MVAWIKELFKRLEFKELEVPPMCIMQSIGKWYNTEKIHWMGYMSGSKKHPDYHYAIELTDVLSSLQQYHQETNLFPWG